MCVVKIQFQEEKMLREPCDVGFDSSTFMPHIAE